MTAIDTGLHYPIDLASLPKGWLCDYIGALTETVQSGFACGAHNSQAKGVAHIRPMNISRGGRIELSDLRFVPPEYDDRRLAEGDVLFNNTNSPELIGKTAYVGRDGVGLAFSNHMTRLRVLPVLDPRFAAIQLHYLWSMKYFLHRCVKHVNQASVSSTDLARSVPLVVPPLHEQRRIVVKIEELFSELDKGVESLTTAREQLKAYRQLTLRRAFEGELTADWRNQNQKEETGSALRDRILRHRREEWEQAEWMRLSQAGAKPRSDAWKTRYPEPDCFDEEGLPELPVAWCWAGLDEIVSGKPRSMQSGPFGSNLLHSEFQATGVLVLGIDNVRDGTFSMGSENRISQQKYQELNKYRARPGDLLITVMASLGRTCVVPRDLEPAIITKHVYRVTMEDALVIPEFFNLLLQGPTTSRARMFENAQGQTRPGLNGGILKALPIPLCSRAEQLEIISRLSSVLSQVDQVLATIDEQLAKTTALRQAILKQAFSGQLVPQDVADESAAVLLERVHAGHDEGSIKRRRSTKNAKQEAA